MIVWSRAIRGCARAGVVEDESSRRVFGERDSGTD